MEGGSREGENDGERRYLFSNAAVFIAAAAAASIPF